MDWDNSGVKSLATNHYLKNILLDVTFSRSFCQKSHQVLAVSEPIDVGGLGGERACLFIIFHCFCDSQ
jgi:hypothetical protein